MKSLKLIPPVIYTLAICTLAHALPGALALYAQATQQKPGVNSEALVIQDFEARVSDYAKLHQAIEAKLPALKPTASSEKLAHQQHEFAEQIRKARRGAKQGDILSPQIQATFRKLIAIAMQGQSGARINTSLRSAEPAKLRLRINADYPANVPLQSTPPSLLMNLPKLPEEIEYRIVGISLVLCDAHANLIIDFIPAAIP